MDEQQQPTTPWNPPVPGTTWQPGAAPAEPVHEVLLAPIEERKPGRGRRIAAIGAATALLAAGGFAIVQVAGKGSQGGAETPKAAIEQLVGAINNEDALGAMDLLLPGERTTFKQPLTDMVTELRRLKVLAPAAKLDGVSGVDAAITLGEVRVSEVADDIAAVTLSGHAKGAVDTAKLPIGEFLLDKVFHGEAPTGVRQGEGDFPGSGTPVRLATVKRDGRWYVSIWYSVAEAVRNDGAAVPKLEDALKPAGADTADGAVDQMLQAIAKTDLTAAISGLDPHEAEALQRYAPLFVGDGQTAVDQFLADSGIKLTISDTAYDVAADGDAATVDIKSFKISVLQPDSDPITVDYAAGCIVIKMPNSDGSEPKKTCVNDSTKVLADNGLAALSKIRAGGIRVAKVDGKWFVSPLGSVMFDLVSIAKTWTTSSTPSARRPRRPASRSAWTCRASEGSAISACRARMSPTARCCCRSIPTPCCRPTRRRWTPSTRQPPVM